MLNVINNYKILKAIVSEILAYVNSTLILSTRDDVI